MSRPACPNLRSLFGRVYKIRHEESYRAERTEFRKEEEAWLQIIPCQHGHIYPHGGNLLGWSAARSGPINERVKRVPFATVHQDGADGANVIFDVSHFDEVAAIVQPKRRPPKRVLTPEHLEKLTQARLKFLAEHPNWKPGQKLSQTSDLRGQGRFRAGAADSQHQKAGAADSQHQKGGAA